MVTQTVNNTATIVVRVYKPSTPSGVYAGGFPMSGKQISNRQRTWERVQKSLRTSTNPYTDSVYREQLGSIQRTTSLYYSNQLQYDWPQTVSGQLKIRDDGAYPGRGTALISFVSLTTPLAVAQNNVLGKCKGATWDLPVFVAEANKTISLIQSTALRMSKAIRAVKRGRVTEACDALGWSPSRKQRSVLGSNTRNDWLAYRYGWLPLLGEVKNAAEFAADQLTSQPTTRRFMSTVKASDVKTQGTMSQDIFLGTTGWDPTSLYFTEATGEARAWITVRLLGNQSVRTLSQLNMNPLTLAWELLPYSFVADWFVNVGDFLELQSALAGLTIVDAGYSTLASTKLSFKLTGPNYTSGGYTYQSNNGTIGPTAEKRVYNRTKWVNPSVNLIVDPKLNLSRVADAAALVANAFSKKR